MDKHFLPCTHTHTHLDCIPESSSRRDRLHGVCSLRCLLWTSLLVCHVEKIKKESFLLVCIQSSMSTVSFCLRPQDVLRTSAGFNRRVPPLLQSCPGSWSPMLLCLSSGWHEIIQDQLFAAASATSCRIFCFFLFSFFSYPSSILSWPF